VWAGLGPVHGEWQWHELSAITQYKYIASGNTAKKYLLVYFQFNEFDVYFRSVVCSHIPVSALNQYGLDLNIKQTKQST